MRNKRSNLVVAVTLNPCIDMVMYVDNVVLGETNRAKLVERDAGGKGINLARVLKKLGGQSIASGFIGGGPGAHVASVLDKEGVPHVFVHSKSLTRVSVYVQAGDGLTTGFAEPGPMVTTREFELLESQLRHLLPEAEWLAIGGSIPPGLPLDVFHTLADLGHHHGCKVVLDADGEAFAHGMEGLPDLIKPNLREAEAFLGRPIRAACDAIFAAQALRERLVVSGSKNPGYDPVAIVSLGVDGAVMSTKEGQFAGRSPKIRTRSTIGSGDSMLAGFIWALERGKPIADCLRWGLACGAATATTNGAEVASRSLVLQLLEQAVVCNFDPT